MSLLNKVGLHMPLSSTMHFLQTNPLFPSMVQDKLKWVCLHSCSVYRTPGTLWIQTLCLSTSTMVEECAHSQCVLNPSGTGQDGFKWLWLSNLGAHLQGKCKLPKIRAPWYRALTEDCFCFVWKPQSCLTRLLSPIWRENRRIGSLCSL